MKYLTLEEILILHEYQIKRFGGSFGIRDVTLLESATLRPQASFGGTDLYPDTYSKAAALVHSIITNHAFIDGNKRTGIYAGIVFMRLNGFKVKLNREETLKFSKEVAKNKLTIENIAAWFKKYSKPKKK